MTKQEFIETLLAAALVGLVIFCGAYIAGTGWSMASASVEGWMQ